MNLKPHSVTKLEVILYKSSYESVIGSVSCDMYLMCICNYSDGMYKGDGNMTMTSFVLNVPEFTPVVNAFRYVLEMPKVNEM